MIDLNQINDQTNNVSVIPALDEFLTALSKRKNTDRTLKAYHTDLVKLFEYLVKNTAGTSNQLIAAITPQQIEIYMHDLARDGVKFSTLRRNLTVIREYFNFLKDRGAVAINPAEGVRFAAIHSDIITVENIISMFQFLIHHKQTNNQTLMIRYKRDELILLFMLLYGIRQYHIPALKLSSIQQNGQSVIINVSNKIKIKMSGIILLRLRNYLTQRNTNADTIFSDPLNGKPITNSCIKLLLQELNYAIHIVCTPLALYHTHLYLKNKPDVMQELVSRISHLHSETSELSASSNQGKTIYA